MNIASLYDGSINNPSQFNKKYQIDTTKGQPSTSILIKNNSTYIQPITTVENMKTSL